MNNEAVAAFIVRLVYCGAQIEQLINLIKSRDIPHEQVGWHHVEELLMASELLRAPIEFLMLDEQDG